jgi:hypothetical protein
MPPIFECFSNRLLRQYCDGKYRLLIKGKRNSYQSVLRVEAKQRQRGRKRVGP